MIRTENIKKAYVRLRKAQASQTPYSIYMQSVKKVGTPGLYTIDERLVYYDGVKLKDIGLEEFYDHILIIAKNKKRQRNLKIIYTK